MWNYVQDRFEALGVTNIVWVMNYLGYDGWDCLFPELWPGNDRVDWITWDPYVGPRERWNEEVGYFYRAMEEKSDAEHDFISKPWGLAEFGYWYGTNQAEAYRFYDDAKAFLNSGNYPRLKLYEPYDTISEGRRHPDELHGQRRATTRPSRPATTPSPTTRSSPIRSEPPPPPPPPPTTDHLAGCDTSVESGLSCFGGTYSGTVFPRHQTADGHTGSDSVEVVNTLAVAGAHGLNVKPAPVSATQVGRTYRGEVWVKASRVGLPITLLLRERRANGTAPTNGYTSVTWTATDTQWRLVSASYVGKESGNGLTFSVYGSQMATGQWLRADDFALTSANDPPRSGVRGARRDVELEPDGRRRSTRTSPRPARTTARSDGPRTGGARSRGGSASCRSSRRGRRTGTPADAPTARRSRGSPRSRRRRARRRRWRRGGCTHRSCSSWPHRRAVG